ncbi:zinc finger protein 226-like [Trichogramma pretiosum]|uniref:zinc finger protein 226-like n=1 Tax=Trichogramma pretiosum TaxID=7493 RepID=UPI0006C94466|nr:zinc finger protein 226-like [Trichogramma pretiosum]
MESSSLFNCVFRVKEEPSDVSLNENDRDMIDQKLDLKNFQPLPFSPVNSAQALSKCDEVEIVVECEDVKPNINLLTVKRIDDDFPHHSRIFGDREGYKCQNVFKTETTGEVVQEVFGDVTEQLNLNFDRELVEQSKKRRIKQGIKKHMGAAHNDRKSYCDICGKTFAQKSYLKIHVDSVHNGIKYTCDLCQKTFARKSYLQMHVDSMHNGMGHPCGVCGKTFARKDIVKLHIDSVHNGIKNTCDLCQKTFTRKSYLQIHIDSMHNGINYKCDECQNTFSCKQYLKIHIDAVHNEITHACDQREKKHVTRKNLHRGIKSKHIKRCM